MLVYPAESEYQPPAREEEEPTIIVQTASVVRPEKDPLQQHLPALGQLQGKFAPISQPNRPPHLRPHPPTQPPPHHPQQQPRPYPRRRGPPKRFLLLNQLLFQSVYSVN